MLLPQLASAAGGMSAPRSDDEANAGIGINQVGVLVYPPSMLYSGIHSGEVRIAIGVDETGRLTDYLVTGYTEKGFVDGVVAAIKRWNYVPARTSGRAQSARAEVLFVFRDQGVIVQRLPGAAEREFLSGMMRDNYVYTPYRLRDLDRIPIPVQVVSPAKMVGNEAHDVTVEFYIDEEGRVRMAAVPREAADDIYSAAAVAAVEQWRFEPPMRKGKPVLVLVEQEFKFLPKE
ncbi:MAG: TonB family protein [Oleiharenicola lentus]